MRIFDRWGKLVVESIPIIDCFRNYVYKAPKFFFGKIKKDIFFKKKDICIDLKKN